MSHLTNNSDVNNNQQQITQFGREIFSAAEKAPAKGGFFRKDWWYGRIMEWSMQNEDFKTRMFRFVDVLPTLNSNQEVSKHIKEYFNDLQGKGADIANIFNVGVGVGALAPGLMAKAIRKNVQQMAKMFITGENPKSALPILKSQRANNIAFTVDLLGEATLSEKEAIDYQTRYTEIINWISKDAESWTHNPLLDEDAMGKIPKVNVSVKLTSLYSQVNEKDWQGSIETLKERLRPIFYLAKERSVFINIDMESFHHKDLTFDVFKQLLMEPDFKSYPHWGIVLQAYLRDSYADAEKLVAFAKERGTPFSIRLVKGAYWDYENIVTSQKDWPIPVYTNKQESDANYEKCARLLLDNCPHIKVALASHNVRSLAASACYAESIGLAKNAFEIQMLYGMADELKAAFVQKGYRVREYATVGELIPGMAYLVRRLLENTSNESFLRSKFVEGAELEQLMRDPSVDLAVSTGKHQLEKEFHNEAPLDFTEPEPREKMHAALEEWKKNLGQTYPVIINNKPVTTDRTITRENPSKKDEVVGHIGIAGCAEAEKALVDAKAAFRGWADTDPLERAALVDRLAELILRDRYKLSALEVLEVGKPWAEADGDIIEAIDFCRYYAKEMRHLAQPEKIGKVLGEHSHYIYEPRGVSLVIAPWNFPLAILTGMVTASIVAGNTVIMKPAEQSSIVAHELMKLLIEAGLPAGVVQYVPGLGEEIGEFLTGHKDIDMIAFTGSKQVGLHIIEKAGRTQSGQKM
ncbi:MAG: proline dehydrogenase family protein [Bdellovibrionales bacterium]